MGPLPHAMGGAGENNTLVLHLKLNESIDFKRGKTWKFVL
jgi:hypothetical protein